MFQPAEIRKASVQYCKKLLTNRDPKPGFEEDLAWKRAVHEIRMEEDNTNDDEFSYEVFQESLKMLKNKEGNTNLFSRQGKHIMMHFTAYSRLFGKRKENRNLGGIHC